MNVRPCGDEAVLVELADLDAVLGLAAALRAEPVPGAVDVVPAARTVLVRFDLSRTDAGAVERAVRDARPLPPGARDGAETVEVRVRYDGQDLAEVGELTGLGERGVVAAHTAATWTVAFGGFSPGFGYCSGGDPRLRVPRRDTPRTRVPAGAVGLAGEFTAVYPRESPGGWRLLGRTEARVWDADRDPPALLRPGVRVRFVEVSG